MASTYISLPVPAHFLVTSNPGDFTITGNGTTFTFNLPTASATSRGALSSADWSTFNSKQNALTLTNLTVSSPSGMTVTNGTGAVIGSSPLVLSQRVADSTHNGQF